MNTFRLTPSLWYEKLLNKGYKDLPSVRKAISKADWPERDRILARRIATGYFGKPRKIDDEDVKKLVAERITTEQPKRLSPLPKESPRLAAPTQAAQISTEKEALDMAHKIVERCNEVLDVMLKAKQLNTDVDLSEAQGIVDSLAQARLLIQNVTAQVFQTFGLPLRQQPQPTQAESRGSTLMREIHAAVNHNQVNPQH